MIKIYLALIFLINSLEECASSSQPYFPPQIVFSDDNGQTIYVIDEINQQACITYSNSSSGRYSAYAMKNFRYAIPDSPQSKYYVQLLTDFPPDNCLYGTYWKYGGNIYNSFPSYWWVNSTAFEIKNYLKFEYEMIHSTNSFEDEDHWYSNATCRPDSGELVPCQEIYFKKNTDIPLRLVQVVRRGWNVVRATINYKIISIGKPDEKYFDSIPKNWSLICRDVMLGLYYNPQTINISLHESVQVQIWLPTPPHRINGNDTVRIQWNAKECKDCFTTSPKELIFNIDNFQEKQILTIKRVKDGPRTSLIPTFNGGGFEPVPPEIYPIYSE